MVEKGAESPPPPPAQSSALLCGQEWRVAPTVPVSHCSIPQRPQKPERWGRLAATPALVEHLLQVRIQEHPGGVQLLSDATELPKGRVHFLKVLPGAIVGLWKQPEAAGFDFTELAGQASDRPAPQSL